MDGPLRVAPFSFLNSNHRKRTFQDMSLPTNYPPHLQPRRRPSTPSSDDSNTSSLYQASSSSCQSSSSSAHSSSTLTSSNLRIPTFQVRQGFDLRRPAEMTERPASVPQTRDVIDLTEDTHSPHLHPVSRSLHHPHPPASRHRNVPPREVIDLSDSSGDDIQEQPRPQHTPSSPEIQFIRSRPRSRSVSIGRRGNAYDDLRDRNNAWLRDQLRNAQNGLARFRPRLPALDFPVFPNIFTGGPPDMLDFGTVGFDLDHPHRQAQAAPRLPTYTAPPSPRAGFTRSNVQPDSLMVCPMCDDELGVGETELKKQVWVAKSCGHVYCGECASTRSTGNKRRKQSTGPSQRAFSSCVVDKCGKRLAGKRDMLQIFL